MDLDSLARTATQLMKFKERIEPLLPFIEEAKEAYDRHKAELEAVEAEEKVLAEAYEAEQKERDAEEARRQQEENERAEAERLAAEEAERLAAEEAARLKNAEADAHADDAAETTELAEAEAQSETPPASE